MHGSYFHHLFLVCIWLSVKAPQVGCDAVSINGQQDRAAANQCWEKCSLAANVSRSAAKALESPETCYKECLKKSRSHQFAGNEQDKALSRRIKREDDCVNNYSDPLPKEDINVTVEYIPFARGLHPFFNATISWSVSSDLTSNLTQGYMVSYGLPNKDRLDCRRVLGMSTFFTGFNIETEDPAKKFPLYVKVYPLSRDENRKGKQWKIVSFSMDTNLTSRVWKGKECDELAETKDFLRKEDIQIELILSTGGYYNTIISWNLQSVQSDWGHMIVYELDGLVNDTRTPTFCRAVKKGRNSTRFDVRNKLLLANRSRIRVAVTSLSPKRVRNGSQYQIANFSDARPKEIVPTSPNATIYPSKIVPTSPNGTIYPSNTTTHDLPTNSSKGTERKTLPTAAIVAMCVTVAFGFVVAAVVIWWRLRGKKTKEEDVALLDSGFKFDAFIIYSTTDEKWVKNKLLSTLEKKHNIKCCIHYRDFLPGVPFLENMAQSVYNSRKTIAVVSKSFLSSNYCNHELNIALHRLVERGDNSVIVIKLDDVGDSDLPIELQFRSYIDFTKATDKKTWEYKLVHSFRGERS